MDLYHCMKTFITVIDERSFAAAARKRFRSAPQVSKEINWLEDRLGVQLIRRTTRKLHLTEQGNEIREKSEELTDQYSFSPWGIFSDDELSSLGNLLNELKDKIDSNGG